MTERIANLFVLPVLILFLGQSSGYLLINQQFMVWMAVALLVLEGVLAAFSVQFFQRETVLSRWKCPPPGCQSGAEKFLDGRVFFRGGGARLWLKAGFSLGGTVSSRFCFLLLENGLQ